MRVSGRTIMVSVVCADCRVLLSDPCGVIEPSPLPDEVEPDDDAVPAPEAPAAEAKAGSYGAGVTLRLARVGMSQEMGQLQIR